MLKTALVTGSTDGIGLETARMLASLGHHVLLHGRSRTKLDEAERQLTAIPGRGRIQSYLADLSLIENVETLAERVLDEQEEVDVLINNAGVYTVRDSRTAEGLDVRFSVNTIAPYVLTRALLPRLGSSGRVINLSSAAQAPVDLRALVGQVELPDSSAYAQSKLALTMWSRDLALSIDDQGPAILAINPGSMLGTKMVQQAYGVAGGDLRIGAEILCRAALDDRFAAASGQYFDNDSGRFAAPHPDALDPRKSEQVVRAIERVLASAAESTSPSGV